jgi:hypothetical protein
MDFHFYVRLLVEEYCVILKGSHVYEQNILVALKFGHWLYSTLNRVLKIMIFTKKGGKELPKTSGPNMEYIKTL